MWIDGSKSTHKDGMVKLVGWMGYDCFTNIITDDFSRKTIIAVLVIMTGVWDGSRKMIGVILKMVTLWL